MDINSFHAYIKLIRAVIFHTNEYKYLTRWFQTKTKVCNQIGVEEERENKKSPFKVIYFS